MTNGITLLTCTADKPDAFSLCWQYVLRMVEHVPFRVQWVIVDSSERLIFPEKVPHIGVGHETEYVRGQVGLSPAESFRSNMLAGMAAVKHDKLIFIEHDDWYHEHYISTMFGLLDYRSLVGSARAKYYHVGQRKWLEHGNASHASLCQTGVGRELYGTVKHILRESGKSIKTTPQQLDGTLWKRSKVCGCKKILLPESRHVIAIKGMPGKAGLGIHHKPEELKGYKSDPKLKQLAKWVGEQDAGLYREFYAGENQ